jgi:eukaryotic-like serine/threonine-protein kinase
MTNDMASGRLASNIDHATMTGQIAGSELHSGDILADRFRIESLLGIGGFGFVYRAHDLSLDIDVAVKLLRPELARKPESFERFRTELLLARQVSSPHVVRIHDIAQHQGRWFITMDFIEGQSLERRLDNMGKLPLEEAIGITRGMLDGLSAAHARGVVHRDLKPANILLNEQGTAFITDFGVARSIGTTGMTQTGIVVGTPEYLSPEQARGDSLDARSDLYTVGLMLYEMVCGVLPFSGGTPAETVIQRIIRPPPSLAKARPDLPGWLHALSDRLLKLNPAHRFANAQEALRALETRRVPRQPLNRQLLASAAIVLIAILAGGAWVWSHPNLLKSLTAARTSALPRVALLPLQTANDEPLAALARVIEEDLREWTRADPAHPAVPRRRVLDSLARQTPGMSEEALMRQIADIATSADAKWVLHGSLSRESGALVLDLEMWNAEATPPTRKTSIRGVDVAQLFAAYRTAAPAFFSDAGLRLGDASPSIADPVALGKGLLALDAGKGADAATILAPLTQKQPTSVLISNALLQAQQSSGQDLTTLASDDRIVTQFANDSTPSGRELYARALLDKEKLDEAVRVLETSTKQFPNDAPLMLLYADALDANGEGTNALETLQRYVTIDEHDAHAWFLLGKSAIQQGHADAAVSNYLTRALILNRLAGNRSAEAETSNALGVGYERLGQLEAASQQYSQAVEIREKLGDEEGLAKSLRNLAIVQAVRGDRDAAEKTLDRVKVILEKRNDRAALADLYNDRGVVAEEHGDYTEALTFYRKGLAYRQELNLNGLVAESLNNIAFSEYNLGDYDNALVYWQQALAQYEKVDDRNRALQINESLGLLEIARGHFGPAREKIEGALRIAEDHQLPEEAAVAHMYLAQLDLIEGNYSHSAQAAEKAAQLFARRSDQRGTAEVGVLRANLALAMGDTSAADKEIGLLQTATLSKEQRVALLLASAQRARVSGDAATAAKQIATAESTAGDLHSGGGIRVQLEAIRLALEQTDLARAGKLLTVMRDDATRLAEIPVRLQWLELEVAFALRSGKPQIAAQRYREAVAILKNSGQWADAVVLHELGARALAGNPAEASAAREAADRQQQQMLSQAPEQARATMRAALTHKIAEIAGSDNGS